MAALRSLSFCLLAVGLLLPAAAYTGQTINITAEAGQDSVTLPCGAGKETQILVVEWIRPDLDPDDVLFYRDGLFESDYQHPSFRNRVDLLNRQMKDGNVSLILKDVTMDDTGTYLCTVYHGGSDQGLFSSIHLEVSSPPGTQEGGDEEGGDEEGGDEEGGGSLGLTVGLTVVSVLCVLVGVIAAWICYKKPGCLQRNWLNAPVKQTEPV